MSIKENDIKLVIGSGEYNNNPGWLHTQENELSLLDEKTWGKCLIIIRLL
nr:hypothetical protein BN993_01966 [Virgibacillus halodenitrificans]